MRSIQAAVIAAAMLLTGGVVRSLPAAPATSTQEELLFDFEPGGKNLFENADKAEFVTEHATQGTHAMKLALGKDLKGAMGFHFVRGINAAGRWGQFDRFVVDLYVEGGPAKMYCFIRDEGGNGWDERFNLEQQFQPGKRRIEIPIGSIVRQKNQKPLDVNKLTWASISFAAVSPDVPTTLYVDNARLEKGVSAFHVKVLYSFEEGEKNAYVLEDWPDEFKGKSRMTAVEEHASNGKRALRLESHAPAGNVQFKLADEDTNWSDYDTLAIDVFNPANEPVPVGGWIKDKPADTWDNRYNWERVLKPGFNCLRLSVGGMAFPSGNRRTLDPAHISTFNLSVNSQTVFIDNIRLVKGVEEVAVEGIRKFDFGPKAGAVMPGFTAVNRETAYDKSKGFGWLPRGDFARDFDVREVMNRHRPFDDLVRDSCCPTKATFAVDVPDGDYQVWIMLNAPGGSVWHRFFKHRTVSVNGQVAVDQQYDAESFKKVEYQWQDTEDLPGDDLWERYINTSYTPVLVEAKAEGGQVTIDFDAHGEYFGCMVCGLALWPKAQEAQAQKWLANLNSMRKEQYAALHVEQPPKAAPPFSLSAEQAKFGVVRFIHSPDRDVEVNSTPTPEEVAGAAMDLAASPGEFEDGCIGVYPVKDSKLSASVGDLTSGANRIPASNLSLQVMRYKAVNHDATYSVEPRYLDSVPASGLALKKGVTRSLWLIVKVPADAVPGAYSGRVSLSLDGKAIDPVPVTLTVWPIVLSEPGIPMGMFMMTPQVDHIAFLDSREPYFQAWKDVLDDARAHGMTSVDPGIGARVRAVRDGKADIDFTDMDRLMDLTKAAGFKQELCGYAIGPGFTIRPQVLDDGSGDKAAQNLGLKNYGELVKAYFDSFREHANAKGYLPICFGSDDEYLIHPGAGPARCEQFHKVLKDNAPGFRFVALDSIYPDEKPDLIPHYESMLRQIDTWGAGLHSPKMAELVKKSGSRLWLYNTGLNRFTFGTYMFYAAKKYDVKGFFQWVYPIQGTLTKYDMASHRESNYGVVYPSDRGLRSTPIWERIRGGCDDHRYLQTAWELAAANVNGAKAADAKALQEAIDRTLAKLQFGKQRVDPASGEGKADNPMDPGQMEKFRRTLADGILKLQTR